MFPPYPQELAHHYCLSLIDRIETGRLSLKQISRESEERKGQGLMAGCLVCWDNSTGKRVVLYALSGNGRVVVPGTGELQEFEVMVAPLVSPGQVEGALAQNDLLIHQLTELINGSVGDEKKSLIQKRTVLTDQSLAKVFDLYTFTRFDGKKISLNSIINQHFGKLPPTGTGDCCAPKLLSYAFEHGLEPVSMDEIYFGKDTKSKVNGRSYPPCDERCGYILPEIIGLEILYRDNDIVVVNKQSGVLSVPGRGPEKADCIEARLRKLVPECIEQPAVHRLDMETSGILILALNKNAHSALERQFEEGSVHKQYIALLDGILKGKPEGHIELKFRLDVDNRPHQIYDEVDGKLGITDWKKLGVEKWVNPVTGKEKMVTRIEFSPKTGRTHQLRLASSHPKGMGIPILGDTLYGSFEDGERLMLHAYKIEFQHPCSGKPMVFECKPAF